MRRSNHASFFTLLALVASAAAAESSACPTVIMAASSGFEPEFYDGAIWTLDSSVSYATRYEYVSGGSSTLGEEHYLQYADFGSGGLWAVMKRTTGTSSSTAIAVSETASESTPVGSTGWRTIGANSQEVGISISCTSQPTGLPPPPSASPPPAQTAKACSPITMTASAGSDWQDYDGAVWVKDGNVYKHARGGRIQSTRRVRTSRKKSKSTSTSVYLFWVESSGTGQDGSWRVGPDVDPDEGYLAASSKDSSKLTPVGSTGWYDFDGDTPKPVNIAITCGGDATGFGFLGGDMTTYTVVLVVAFVLVHLGAAAWWYQIGRQKTMGEAPVGAGDMPCGQLADEYTANNRV